MADAKASVFRLLQVDSGFESVGRSYAAGLRVVLKRAGLSDAGAIDGLIAWESHVLRCDIRNVCV